MVFGDPGGQTQAPHACRASTLLIEELYRAPTPTISCETPTNQEIIKTENEEVKLQGDESAEVLGHVPWYYDRRPDNKQLKERQVAFVAQL